MGSEQTIPNAGSSNCLGTGQSFSNPPQALPMPCAAFAVVFVALMALRVRFCSKPA